MVGDNIDQFEICPFLALEFYYGLSMPLGISPVKRL